MKTLMKLLALGSLAVLCTSNPVCAGEGNGRVGQASRKGEGRKPPVASRMYVAIDKFNNTAGITANQFNTIRARIQQAVIGTRKFQVLEREQLKNVLSEQNLIAAGVTNGEDEDAPASGKLKAAGYVIYGNVLFYGRDQSRATYGGGGDSNNMRVKVELQVKITSAETGRILASKSVIGIGQQSRIGTYRQLSMPQSSRMTVSSSSSRETATAAVSSPVLGGGAQMQNTREDVTQVTQYDNIPSSQNFPTEGDFQTGGNILEQCEREAVAQAAHFVVDALRDVCYPAKIVRVGKGSVSINMTNEEVAEDDLFDVIEAGEEIIDPDTGASLGNEGDEIGRIRITRPGPLISKAVPADDDLDLKDIEVGYIVRRVSEETLKKERAKAKKRRSDEFEARF